MDRSFLSVVVRPRASASQACAAALGRVFKQLMPLPLSDPTYA
jgi:hypothetical protein